MPDWQGKRKLAVVTAYMRPDGLPDFTLNEVEVTYDEYTNGVHYNLVDTILGEGGFEEPLLHFDEFESPPFLLPAVKEYLESRTTTIPSPEPDAVYPF
jgi:hypothetical protein